MLDHALVTSLVDKAKSYFISHKPSHRAHANDFAQYCADLWISGERSTKTDFAHLATDFLRQVRALSGKGSPDALAHKPIPIDKAPTIGETSKDIYEFEGVLRNPPVDKYDRAVLVLFFRWGLTLREIGEVFGVSESAIAHIHKRALELLRKRCKYLD